MTDATLIRLPEPAAHQREKLEDPRRFLIWVAGRRARKTVTAVLAAILGRGPGRRFRGAISGGNIWVIGLSYPQSSSLWRMVKGILQPIAVDISEVERRIVLPGGGAITVKSAVNYEALVGDVRGLDGVVLDEAAKFPPEVWAKAIRPALSDRLGWALFTTTPEGDNWFRELFDAAKKMPETWGVYQESSLCNPFFDPQEIERAKAEGMSDYLIASEFGGEFVSQAVALAYYEFSRDEHIRDLKYDPFTPLLDCCVSFRVAPPAWIVSQGSVTPQSPERVLDEIIVPDPSPRALVAEFFRRYPRHKDGRNVRIYGDASSAIGGKSTDDSDFAALRLLMPQAKFYVRHDSRPEKASVNYVNDALRDPSGQVCAQIDPRAARLIRDLEQVRTTGDNYIVDRDSASAGHYALAWANKLMRVRPMSPGLRRAREAA